MLVAVAALFLMQLAPAILASSSSSSSSVPPLNVAPHCSFFLGKSQVVDDRGHLCDWSAGWNASLGCCPASFSSAAQHCALHCPGNAPAPGLVHCCASYESCVSCCVARGTIFRICLRNCRFSSREIDGISFKGKEHHFCFH